MIQLVKSSETNFNQKYKCKIGDKLRFPVDASMMIGRSNYNFKFFKYDILNCTESTEIEVSDGRLVPFSCMKRGSFRLRVKNYDSNGNKQFAINIGGVKLGKTFKSKANSLSEYITKIVNHFNKAKGWDVESNGNIINFRQSDDCYNCGTSVTLSIGDYNIPNQNAPCLQKTFIATEEVIGTKCYLLNFTDFQEGNKFTVDGLTILVESGDSENDLRSKIHPDSEYYCIPNSATIAVSSDNGLRTVINRNNPRITFTYLSTDATYDYYTVKTFDVRSGNVFDINGVRIVASDTDTQTTIDAFFNAYTNRFRLAKGTSINPVALSGSRLVSNTNNPEIEALLTKTTATANKDKYAISVCNDVAKGNAYTLGTNYYVAKDGDSSIDVAYGLIGANSSTFLHYSEEGSTLDCYATPGYARNDSNIADVGLLCTSVNCCDKKSMIFEFEAKEFGCYQGILFNQHNQEIAKTTLIEVVNDIDEDLVSFSNETNTYGLEFDKNEIFSLRLPIFLQDVFPFTTEELNENLNGEIVRGKTTIQNRRNFVTKPISSLEHSFLLKILKCDYLNISGVNYKMQGEYDIEQQRQGVKDIRSASGLLVVDGNIASNMRNCISGCS
ncbi:MAG: hypothetical protein IPP61_00365 [Cytophagaceae bacterium]|nr:hypothetical protein [Cytophagaceae bacterium]MBL0304277.1 hypothetical protein [Cytophagaceae bacterium]MBL0304357.1 hypothetical protein [Cytophagaceae bacterium]MBL0323633.1 hypothetical protein [Cytophagaceae bacterium]